MTSVTYKREGNRINPIPISIKHLEPYQELDPGVFIDVMLDSLIAKEKARRLGEEAVPNSIS